MPLHRKHSQCDRRVGVRMYTKVSTRGVEVYAEASHPVRKSAKRFYAGLFANTLTEQRWKRALELARQARVELIERHEKLHRLIPSQGAAHG